MSPRERLERELKGLQASVIAIYTARTFVENVSLVMRNEKHTLEHHAQELEKLISEVRVCLLGFPPNDSL